jgi:SAM-dependent methyltransferase
MITEDKLRSFVSSRSWYQTIKFEEGIVAKGCEWCGDPAWGNIAEFLPLDLEGMRILDLGCNAGLFCVRSAIMGAQEVIGIDYTGWRPNWDFEEQQVFVKQYFDQKMGRELPITFLSGRMEEILKTKDLGKFDYVYAIASIYYVEDPEGTVKEISRITDKAIVRLRDTNRIERFVNLFKKYGWREERVLREKWWEVLDRQTDDFYLYLFVKD